MNKTLTDIKKEARERMRRFYPLVSGSSEYYDQLDYEMDRLLEEVEKAVLANTEHIHNNHIKYIREAFTKFKGI